MCPVDNANQDNCLEEALNVRSESLNKCAHLKHCPVASDNIHGRCRACCHCWSENTFSPRALFLRDVADGKEQAFGALMQHMVAKVGGRLHYGHPDFLKLIFMTTCGGMLRSLTRGLCH